MPNRKTESKIKNFLSSSFTRKWISEPDEVQLQDSVRRAAQKLLDNPLIVTASAISNLEPTIRREIISRDPDCLDASSRGAFELFQLALTRHPVGVLCVCDLECIDVDSLVFLGRLVDHIKASKSAWKVVFSGDPQRVAEACLQRLGIAYKKGKTKKDRDQRHSEWSETITSILNTKVI